MHKFNPFRLKLHHHSSQRTKAATPTILQFNSRPYTQAKIDHTEPIQPINISAPIINHNEKVVINDKDPFNENSNEKQAAIIANNNIEEQIVVSEESEKMSDVYHHADHQVD